VQGNGHSSAICAGTVAGLNPNPLPANQIGTLQFDRAYTQTAAGTFGVNSRRQQASTSWRSSATPRFPVTQVELFNGSLLTGVRFRFSAAGGVGGRLRRSISPTILRCHSDG
jgi:hypothetical protein